jgi:hypothetical protein
MRTAKLILSGVVFFSVIGAVLASKAHRGVPSFCRVSNTPGVCTTTLQNITHFTTNVPTQGVTTYCTGIVGNSCFATVTRLSVWL